MVELIGTITTILAIIGVVCNNHKLRVCFLIWLVSNGGSAFVHFMAWHGGAECLALLGRDLIFLLLAVHGWYKWRK